MRIVAYAVIVICRSISGDGGTTADCVDKYFVTRPSNRKHTRDNRIITIIRGKRKIAFVVGSFMYIPFCYSLPSLPYFLSSFHSVVLIRRSTVSVIN